MIVFCGGVAMHVLSVPFYFVQYNCESPMDCGRLRTTHLNILEIPFSKI